MSDVTPDGSDSSRLPQGAQGASLGGSAAAASSWLLNGRAPEAAGELREQLAAPSGRAHKVSLEPPPPPPLPSQTPDIHTRLGFMMRHCNFALE